ncbi:unnamed protein product [Linum trigynum]|uniref:DUF4283 domain-containing protein n=1 Tax=Linum trigynum TaxID=586398 RepID=A0AAV2GJC1_9ROSI
MRDNDQDMGVPEDDDPLSPTIPFSTAELKSYRGEWRSALIIKVLWCMFPYPVLSRRLNMLWAKTRTLQIANKSHGYYFVCFTSKADYDMALTGGPWMIGDHYLTTQKWRKGFNPRSSEITSTLVCMQVSKLPIEFFNPATVLKIAKCAGKPIRVDRAIELGARGKFFRVCVEVDLTKQLLSRFKIEGIEYEIQ